MENRILQVMVIERYEDREKDEEEGKNLTEKAGA